MELSVDLSKADFIVNAVCDLFKFKVTDLDSRCIIYLMLYSTFIALIIEAIKVKGQPKIKPKKLEYHLLVSGIAHVYIYIRTKSNICYLVGSHKLSFFSCQTSILVIFAVQIIPVLS